jgi:hypothetical protein
MWERGEKHIGFWWGNLRERDHFVDPGIDARIILKWTFKKCDEDMNCIDLAQDKDRWRVLVNVIMNFWVP